MARSHGENGRIAVLGDRDMSRGFKDTQNSNGSVLGEKFFSMIQTQQEKQKNSKTENATEWFRRPAYYFGERRHIDTDKRSDDNL